MEVKKAIIPAAGLGTRFLPITKVLPKEFLPLAGLPMVEYAVREIKEVGISNIIFLLSENKKFIIDYFKKNQKLENVLAKNNRKKELEAVKEKEKEYEEISFSSQIQPFRKGDGEALLKVKNYIKREGFAVVFPDDLFISNPEALSQLIKVFATSSKMVVGLKKISKDKASSCGTVLAEKIANKLYKIKKVKGKLPQNEIPSDLVVVGRYVLTPEIFNYLKKASLNEKGEIILAQALNLAIEDGKIIYGCELSGDWFECGNKLAWLKANLHFSLRHPEYGPILKEWLKKEL